jgi:competence protein ComEA
MRRAAQHWGFTPGEKRAILLILAAFLVAAGYRVIQNRAEFQPVAISTKDSLAVEAIKKAYLAATLPDSDEAVDDTSGNGKPLNLNTATRMQLEALPGIGPVIAGRILEARDRAGSFSELEDLLAVPGIGVKRLEKIRPLVTLSNAEMVGR